MSKYKGLFTFDADNHRYVPVEQADGLISDMNYHPEPEEEPRGYFYIRDGGNVDYYRKEGSITGRHKSIGNYFETKEEAEKALEKLKAWKRLKDKGIRFTGFSGYTAIIEFTFDNYCSGVPSSAFDDLNLLFGGEDE